MRNKKTLWLSLLIATFIFLLWQENLFSNEQESRVFKLTPNQEELINLVNEKRVEKEMKPFHVSMRLTQALTQRLEGIVREAQSKSDEKLIGGRIEEFLSNLGPDAFFSSDSSTEKAFNKLMKDENLKGVLCDPGKTALANSIVRINTGRIFIVFYFSEFPIEWGFFGTSAVLENGSTKAIEDALTITGTSKSRYLRLIMHKGGKFYFERKKSPRVDEEVSVEVNGSFSVTFPVRMFGTEDKWIAVLSKKNESEDYVLVDYLIVPYMLSK